MVVGGFSSRDETYEQLRCHSSLQGPRNPNEAVSP